MALERRKLEPLARLVKFATQDELRLAGLLFEPKRKSTRAAIFLHGMGGSFESGRTNVLARAFTARGIAWFAFNNRGSYVMRRGGGGMAYEKIRDAVYDIDAAIREVRSRGYRDLTLIGHSTGANKIVVFDHYKRRNTIKRYALLGGGDDTGLAYLYLGPNRFPRALEEAREMIHAGRGDQLVPLSLSPYVTSWRSFYDVGNPDGDYNTFPFLEVLRGLHLSRRPHFRYLREIRKPTLILYGDKDEYCYNDVPGCVAILKGVLDPAKNFELGIMNDTDHSFTDREAELAQRLLDWLDR